MKQKEAKLWARESGSKLNLNIQARNEAKSVKVTKHSTLSFYRTQENHAKISLKIQGKRECIFISITC